MRRFLVALLVPMLCIVVRCTSAFAAPPQALAPDVEATNLLLHGKRYERAAELMHTAIAAKPDDYAAHLTLGCAYADRVAALVYAALFNGILARERKAYPDRLKAWETQREAARKENRPFDERRPLVPPEETFPTRDDNLPYRLTNTELSAQVSDLSAKAQAAWDRAAEYAKTDADKAQVEYVRGWGLRLLYNYCEIFLGGSQESGEVSEPDASANDREVGAAPPPRELPITLQNVPTKKQIAAALERAVTLAPDHALYWQARGDAEEDDKKAIAAYEKSLALQPKNGSLWSELYLRSWNDIYGTKPDFLLKPGEKKPDMEKGIGYLRNAAKYDGTNAWYLYGEATLRMEREMFGTYFGARTRLKGDPKLEEVQKAVLDKARLRAGHAITALVETGNQRYTYRYPRYKASVPNLLSAAWEYLAPVRDFNREDLSNIFMLGRGVCGYGLAAALQNNDPAEGLRITQVVIQMGTKLVGEWSLKDIQDRERVAQIHDGNISILWGLMNRVKIYEAAGDTAAKATAQAELDSFNARRSAFNKAAAFEETQIWKLYYH